MKNLYFLFFFNLVLYSCKGVRIIEGDRQKAGKQTCGVANLAEKIISLEDESEKALSIQAFFNRCGKTLRKINKPKKTRIGQLIHDSKVRYPYQSTKWFSSNKKEKGIQIEDSLYTNITGFLGMKERGVKRPLVILNCGIQCGGEDASMAQLVSFLFDESDFHVLALPNISTEEYQRQNKSVVFGGLEEGRNLLTVVRYMREESPWKNDISSVHVVGVSLGAHAVFYSGLYETAMKLKKPLIDSRIVGCPVVDLESSMNELYELDLVGIKAIKNFRKQVNGLKDTIKILSEEIPREEKKIRLREASDFLVRTSARYYREKGNDIFSLTPPFKGKYIVTGKDFSKFNRFQDYQLLNKKPVFIWSAKNDVVVKYRKNTKAFLKKLKSKPNNAYSFIVTPKGNHCNFAQNYGWETVGKLFRSYILSRSPVFKQRRVKKTLKLKKDQVLTLNEEIILDEVYWKAAINKKEAFLHVKFKDIKNKKNQIKEVIAFSFEELGLTEYWFPKNLAEEQALTRRLNARYRVWGNKIGLLGQNEVPQFVEWATFL